MRYIPEDTQVVLREVPDEISLSVNISNCPHRCPGCHSPYLQKNVGEELTLEVLSELIEKNTGISCVCFFGGDSCHEELIPFFVYARGKGLMVAWYSGDDSIDENMKEYVDYYKIGGYREEFGPLNSENTNQRMYRVENGNLVDITKKFIIKW